MTDLIIPFALGVVAFLGGELDEHFEEKRERKAREYGHRVELCIQHNKCKLLEDYFEKGDK